MVARLLAKTLVAIPAADHLLWAAEEKAEPLLMRLDPARRAKVIMALLGLVLLGLIMIVVVVSGGRTVLRLARKSHGPTARSEDHWYRKPLDSGEPQSSPSSDSE